MSPQAEHHNDGPSIREFKERLEKADWYHEWADSMDDVRKGRLEISALKDMANKYGSDFVNAFRDFEKRMSE